MGTFYDGGIKAGATSQSIQVGLRSTTDGSELTGKVAADFTLAYWREGETAQEITAVDLAAVDSAYAVGGVKEVDATLFPGLYRLDVPDASIATGSEWVMFAAFTSDSYVFMERYPLTVDPWVTAMTEAYRAVGAAPTPVQALCELLSLMGEKTISGTLMTLKKFDRTTAAMTYLINDAANPTGITRNS